MLNIKKLKHLHIHEKKLHHEKYKETLSYQEAVIIFKVRFRTVDLRDSFRSKYELFGCLRHSLSIDNKAHWFTKCSNINDIRKQQNISDYYEVFEAGLRKRTNRLVN